MENGSDYLLSINVKTWNKNTEDLYDFESKDIKQSTINQNGNSTEFYLLKSNDSIIKSMSIKDLISNSSLKATKFFCHIAPSNKNGFDILSHYASPNLHWIPEGRVEEIWLRLPKTDYTQLKIGDIVKMGRVRIKLTTVSPILQNYEDNVFVTSVMNSNCDNNTNTNNNGELSERKPQKDMCRICYCYDSDFENPLVAPCKCTGSMHYIHIKCLQSAISNKFTIVNNNNFTLITWKGYECEICLNEYPKYMIYKNKTYSMTDYTLIPYSKYIMFDLFIYDDEKFKANRKGILIINTEETTPNNEITIGRTQTNQVKLKNISVSRVHCTMKIVNDNVFIKDNGSKFGTLLYLQQKFTLMEENAITNGEKEGCINMSIQGCYYGNNCVISSGRLALFFQLTKSRNFFMNLFNFNCCKQKNINDSDCVIDLNNDEIEDDDVINNKHNRNNNIYNDHVIIIDSILQSLDYSP